MIVLIKMMKAILNQYFIYSMRARIKKIKLLHQGEFYFIICWNCRKKNPKIVWERNHQL